MRSASVSKGDPVASGRLRSCLTLSSPNWSSKNWSSKTVFSRRCSISSRWSCSRLAVFFIAFWIWTQTWHVLEHWDSQGFQNHKLIKFQIIAFLNLKWTGSNKYCWSLPINLLLSQWPPIFQAFLGQSVFSKFFSCWVVIIGASGLIPGVWYLLHTGHGNQDICRQDLNIDFFKDWGQRRNTWFPSFVSTKRY